MSPAPSSAGREGLQQCTSRQTSRNNDMLSPMLYGVGVWNSIEGTHLRANRHSFTMASDTSNDDPQRVQNIDTLGDAKGS